MSTNCKNKNKNGQTEHQGWDYPMFSDLTSNALSKGGECTPQEGEWLLTGCSVPLGS